jgi:hypothetical protein
MAASQAIAGNRIRDCRQEETETGDDKDDVEHDGTPSVAGNILRSAYEFECAPGGASI